MATKRRFHLFFGLILLFLGIYGAYDEIFNVVDFIKGAMQPATLLAGAFILFLGLKRKDDGGITKNALMGTGAVILLVGFYGLYDEWYSFIDMVMGAFPLACIAFGTLSLIVGINKLKA
ncbi:MAG: hypothetical protein HQK51_12095 [Oligoflexia bacterium]|nr:hypothetical protein [Oligoflexia bacterium]